MRFAAPLFTVLLALSLSACGIFEQAESIDDGAGQLVTGIGDLREQLSTLTNAIEGSVVDAEHVEGRLSAIGTQLTIAEATDVPISATALRAELESLRDEVRRLRVGLQNRSKEAARVTNTSSNILGVAEIHKGKTEQHAETMSGLNPMEAVGWASLLGGPLAAGGYAINRRRKQRAAEQHS